MKINQRTANSLANRNMAEIGQQFDPIIKRQAVFEWVKYRRVPDGRVERLEEITGLKIK